MKIRSRSAVTLIAALTIISFSGPGARGQSYLNDDDMSYDADGTGQASGMDESFQRGNFHRRQQAGYDGFAAGGDSQAKWAGDTGGAPFGGGVDAGDIQGMGGGRQRRRGPEQGEAAGNERQNGPVSFQTVDDVISQAMQQYTVPGAAIAIARDGQLMYARGYGLANIRTGEQATETTFFNLASCTKAISMFGTLRLQEEGKLDLDSPVYDVIGRPELPRDRVDPRVLQITVRQLLHHSGGWNDDSGFIKASKEVNRLAPNGMPYKEAVRILFMTPLDYTPGTQAKYANGQWNLIKYVIECASQMPYGQYMRRQLATIGITDMHEESKGHTPGEATRYAGNPPRVCPSGKVDVALQPAFGNWMATSVDMAKFLTAIDGSRMQGITRRSFQQMIAPLPPPMVNNQDGGHFGLGMDVVKQTDDGLFFTKNGGKPGVHAQIEHLPSGVDFCLFMNGGTNPDGSTANPMPLRKIIRILNQTTNWPQQDLFQRYQ